MKCAARLIGSEVFVVLVLAIVVSAQTSTTTLSGAVKDSSGTPVTNAKIALRNLNTGLTGGKQSDAERKYTFSGLESGEYELSVSAEGFAAKTVNILLSAPAQTQDIVLTANAGPSLSDLGFSTAETEANPAEQARLDKRTHMLKIHSENGPDHDRALNCDHHHRFHRWRTSDQ